MSANLPIPDIPDAKIKGFASTWGANQLIE